MEKRDFIFATIVGAEVGLMFQPIVYNLWPELAKASALYLGLVPPQALFQICVFAFFTFLAPAALFALFLLSKFAGVIYQFGKFATVGSSNSFVDIGLLNLALILFNIEKGTAAFTIIATCTALISTVNSYFWNKFWTFEAGKAEGKRFWEVLKFYGVTGFSSLVNGAVTTAVASSLAGGAISLGLAANAGKIAGIFSAFIFNFLGYKFVVFKKPGIEGGATLT